MTPTVINSSPRITPLYYADGHQGNEVVPNCPNLVIGRRSVMRAPAIPDACAGDP
jgi:hypothetical protein